MDMNAVRISLLGSTARRVGESYGSPNGDVGSFLDFLDELVVCVAGLALGRQ